MLVTIQKAESQNTVKTKELDPNTYKLSPRRLEIAPCWPPRPSPEESAPHPEATPPALPPGTPQPPARRSRGMGGVVRDPPPGWAPQGPPHPWAAPTPPLGPPPVQPPCPHSRTSPQRGPGCEGSGDTEQRLPGRGGRKGVSKIQPQTGMKRKTLFCLHCRVRERKERKKGQGEGWGKGRSCVPSPPRALATLLRSRPLRVCPAAPSSDPG